MPEQRGHPYVGPDSIRDAARNAPPGASISSREALDAWAASRSASELRDPLTYVVDLDGVLRLAPRRSEHVACASGREVLGAGELVLARDGRRWRVAEITNLSTGYCPHASSWAAVAAALDRAAIARPSAFTLTFAFRRCLSCRAVQVVKDDDDCLVCGASLA
jgi:hypothetical protein